MSTLDVISLKINVRTHRHTADRLHYLDHSESQVMALGLQPNIQIFRQRLYMDYLKAEKYVYCVVNSGNARNNPLNFSISIPRETK